MEKQRYAKRKNVSAASCFFTDSEDGEAEVEAEEWDEEVELKAYLELPQIKFKTEKDCTDWRKEQYLGCPVPIVCCCSRASMFSHVGIAFSEKSKRSK